VPSWYDTPEDRGEREHAAYEAALLAGTDLLDPDPYWRGLRAKADSGRRAQVAQVSASKRRELVKFFALLFCFTR